MIVFDLQCFASGDRFEAWFGSNADFERQLGAGLVQCPFCQSSEVAKAPMAPLVPRLGDGASEGADMLARLASLQADLLRDSKWVGEEFPETARAMHEGDIEPAPVHGQATAEQVQSLVDDGVPIAPLPLPVVPPNQVN